MLATAAGPISLNIWTFIFQTINVLIVLAVLYKLLYKPLGRILQEREDFVERSLSEAEEKQRQAEALLTRYTRRMREAHKEAEQVVAQAVAEGEEEKQRLIREAQLEASRKLEEIKAELAAEKEQVLREVRDEVARMVLEAAERVVRREIDDATHRKLVREVMDKVGEAR